MRRIVVGLAAIALFAAAAMAGIWVLTRDGSRGPAPAATAGPPVTVAPPPLQALPGLTGSPQPAAPPQATPAPLVYGPPRVEPPKGSWEAVAVAARPAALGPLGGAIGRGLNELQPRLAACFDEDTAARFGPQPRSLALDPSLPNSGTPVLILQIETGGGQARIVDAPVDTQGGASDGVISCAQSLLRGRRFPFPQAPPNGKYRMLHPLMQ